MTKGDRLLAALDRVFGFPDRKRSTVKKRKQLFDEKTGEHVFILACRPDSLGERRAVKRHSDDAWSKNSILATTCARGPATLARRLLAGLPAIALLAPLQPAWSEEMRGLLVMGHESRSLQPCDDGRTLWVQVRGALRHRLE